MSGKAVRETMGFLAVVAGLVFVGVEIQQNSQSVQAATYQDLIAQITNLNVLEIENPEFGALVQATLVGPSPERPDEAQISQLTPYLWLLFRHGDLAFSQYQRGLLDDERLRSVLMPLSARLRLPWIQGRWEDRHRAAFVPSYQNLVDSIIAASQ